MSAQKRINDENNNNKKRNSTERWEMEKQMFLLCHMCIVHVCVCRGKAKSERGEKKYVDKNKRGK